ncbi:MAG: NAD(P)-binding domain-containing protein [Chloracidobacterium sp.]|nr:NAD(P)-binding domain-containing protein [Chloracidobacterium sp.]
MKRSQLTLTTILFVLLLILGYAGKLLLTHSLAQLNGWVGLLTVGVAGNLQVNYGAAPPAGWIGLFLFVAFVGFWLVITDTRRSRQRVIVEMQDAVAPAQKKPEASKTPQPILDPQGLPYPHPIINVNTCIGCHACVDACPHDVLAIINGKAALVAVEQCMEDTSCEVECPTVPKSCIVVNSNKKIPLRKVPKRDGRFLTSVPGIYLIGDVSGVPLIKNAINEGGSVIDFVAEDIKQLGGNGKADYDVAIVGMGPAGLSAAALAAQRGMKYIALEQDEVAATIQQTYQAGKYIYFNPTDQPVKGGITLEGAGAIKEQMLGSWMETVRSNGVVINEFEGCKDVKRDGDVFIVVTDQDKTKQRMEYRARRVVLAIGNRGTPMKLNVPGEDLKMIVSPTGMIMPQFCNKCGEKRAGDYTFCQRCGFKYIPKPAKPYEDERVKYKLSDPNKFSGKHVLIVGAGNSAVEAAIDLAAYRSEEGTELTGWRDNAVSLVIRSNFKSDLKLGNKMMIYDCMDAGRVKSFFGQTIKEVTSNEVVLMNARERDPKTAKETARIKNDYVFALIGGEKPTKFLESIGIKIG